MILVKGDFKPKAFEFFAMVRPTSETLGAGAIV